ncbi:MAG: hypothetical protein ACRC0V_09780 [Fusobacteriaceae bacterium]
MAKILVGHTWENKRPELIAQGIKSIQNLQYKSLEIATVPTGAVPGDEKYKIIKTEGQFDLENGSTDEIYMRFLNFSKEEEDEDLKLEIGKSRFSSGGGSGEGGAIPIGVEVVRVFDYIDISNKNVTNAIAPLTLTNTGLPTDDFYIANNRLYFNRTGSYSLSLVGRTVKLGAGSDELSLWYRYTTGGVTTDSPICVNFRYDDVDVADTNQFENRLNPIPGDYIEVIAVRNVGNDMTLIGQSALNGVPAIPSLRLSLTETKLKF